MRLTNADIKRLGIVIDGDRAHIDRKQKPKPVTVKVPVVQWDAKIIPGGVWIQIPFPLPSMNEWTKWDKRYKLAPYKRELVDAVYKLKLVLGLPKFHFATIQAVYYFKDSRRRDSADNYGPKLLNDALVRGGILVDDNDDLVNNPKPELKVDKVMPRSEIFVYDAEE